MRLSDCFVKLIAYVTYFLNTAGSRQPPFDQVKADIRRIISESETCVIDGAVLQENYDLAKFAVCAWVDEAVLGSTWNGREKWQREQLQRFYYETVDAGELFFERLNSLGPHQGDVREVYYLCLAMGFTGRYCNEGDAFLLQQLKTSNLKLLTGSSLELPSLEKGELFPEAYLSESVQASPKRERFRFSIFTLFCLSAPVVLYGVLFLIYRFVLNNMGKAL
ncbi:MAG: DotU family type IV/VI secretion system protein [Thermodesulfobacteriota bacterium]|nr:DotU family type IV/VI secretion system protein [Thermodesulfobacteriota bacterium]